MGLGVENLGLRAPDGLLLILPALGLGIQAGVSLLAAEV